MKNPAKNLPEKMTIPLAKSIMPDGYEAFKLNTRELKLVAAYCSNGFDAKKAAIQAGFNFTNQKTANEQAYQILRRPSLQLAIKKFLDSILQPYKDRLETEILQRYYKRATFPIDAFYNEHGSLKALSEVTDEWKEVIDGITTQYFGKDADRKVTTYQLPNRDTALQMLLKLVTGTSQAPQESSQEMRSKLDSIFGKAKKSAKKMTITFTQEELNPPKLRNVSEE